jgi:hypothetical protein
MRINGAAHIDADISATGIAAGIAGKRSEGCREAHVPPLANAATGDRRARPLINRIFFIF